MERCCASQRADDRGSSIDKTPTCSIGNPLPKRNYRPVLDWIALFILKLICSDERAVGRAEVFDENTLRPESAAPPKHYSQSWVPFRDS